MLNLNCTTPQQNADLKVYHHIEKTYNRNSESVIKVIEAKKDDNHNGCIRSDKKALLLIL